MLYKILALCLSVLIIQSYLQTKPAFSKTNKKRFIPVELWTGAKWNRQNSIQLRRANLIFGSEKEKKIVGPRTWRSPWSGKSYTVYVRTNRSKTQYFALHSSKQGLGRVYDSRKPRYCDPGFKFPLGWWKQGEKRTKSFQCSDGRRVIRIEILDIDFVYKGAPNSLKFRWTLNGGFAYNTDNIYIYSPGHGMVYYEPL